MINNHKIAIIIAYYGQWPEWTPFFLQSCSKNTDIHWLLFSGNTPPGDLPKNVEFYNLPINLLEQKILDALGIKPDIVHPYKLTDFKPAYGLIFGDYLGAYTHWGYSDLDLFYGSISNFIDDRMLAGYDIISPSPDFFPGHFLLLKNNNNVINLFKNAVNWRAILTSRKYYCFDENLLSKGILPDNDRIFRQVNKKIRRHIFEYKAIRNPVNRMIKKMVPLNIGQKDPGEPQDFNQVIKNKSLSGEIKACHKLLFRDDIINLINSNRNINISWDNGKLYDGHEEIMYYHFQLAKYEESLSISSAGPHSFKLSARLTT